MINDIYGININEITVADLKKWASEVPDDYKINLYELDDSYGEETIILAVRPK